MELRVEAYQLPEKISFNFEELKTELQAKTQHYETLVYTDDQIKEAKADRANLNRLKKALNDERIRREKEYLAPFDAFKKQVNEVIAIVDKPIDAIDRQVKEYEEKKKEDKLEAIHEYFDSCEDIPEWLHLEKIFDSRWLNASVSMKSIQETITGRVEQIKTDLATLANLLEFGYEAQQVYISTLDINKALAEGQRMSQIQKQKAAYEAEQSRKREEEERLKQEAEFAKKMNPPVEEPAAEPEKEAVAPAEPAKTWVSFRAQMTTEDALALRDFFQSRNIEFEAI